MSEIEAKVKEMILERFDVVEADITPEANFINDLGADSLAATELIIDLEKEFGVTIPDDQFDKIATVGDAIAFIENNK